MKEAKLKTCKVTYVVCKQCSVGFYSKTCISKFCSSKCKDDYKNNNERIRRAKLRLYKKCRWCFNMFKPSVLRDDIKYCSKECRRIHFNERRRVVI